MLACMYFSRVIRIFFYQINQINQTLCICQFNVTVVAQSQVFLKQKSIEELNRMSIEELKRMSIEDLSLWLMNIPEVGSDYQDDIDKLKGMYMYIQAALIILLNIKCDIY